MKLGIFGGTFDPIHNAHLFIAEAARVELALDRVAFLPTHGAHYRHPPRAPLDDRLAMVRLAIASNPAFALDLTDLDENPGGYTADVVPRLRARHPDDALTFIVGGDSLVASPWRRFDEVLAGLDAFVIVPRGNAGDDEATDRARWRAALDGVLAPLEAELRAKVRVLDVPPIGASATLVRAQLARGGSVRYVVPEPVWRYLEKRALYRSGNGRPA